MKCNMGTPCLLTLQRKLPMLIKSHIQVFIPPLIPNPRPVSNQSSNHMIEGRGWTPTQSWKTDMVCGVDYML